jgi:glycosyltransferase involved in cell wall biosynthesis
VRVAYVMSRFPKLTETFVLFEMLALSELGFEVEVFPLLRERERAVHAQARALVERAYYTPFLSPAILAAQFHFLARSPRAYLATLFQVFLRTLPSPNFLAGAFVFFPKSVLFAREMQRRGVAHVHAHFANHPALAALIVHRLTGIPFSFTAHGSDLHVDQTALGWKIAESAFAVSVSEYNREFVRERAGSPAADKLIVIHCGVDLAQFERAAPGAGATFEILCVAALRTVKGHRHLIDACALLSAAGVPFRCHLVGGGPLERELATTIERAGLGGRVLMHGPQPREAVLERMRSAHVLVQPSIVDRAGRREGIPVTLMEAMATGLPVVASRLSGIPELIEDGRSGLLVEAGDARALADALARLRAEPELCASLGREARARVEAAFDLRRNARSLADAIRGVQGGRAEKPAEPENAPTSARGSRA